MKHLQIVKTNLNNFKILQLTNSKKTQSPASIKPSNQSYTFFQLNSHKLTQISINQHKQAQISINKHNKYPHSQIHMSLISNSYQQPNIKSQLSLELFNNDLFSSIRRNINNFKENQISKRTAALQDLLKILTTQQLPGTIFQQIGHMSIKDLLKCFSDRSEACRQLSTKIVIELLPRSSKINSFLPYIFSILIDRTNCHDLEGISNLPQKMRPPPGQKPKVLIKIVENCEEIRLLYCNLLKKIVTLLEHEGDQIRKHLDDLINIIRALIMDPAPEVQRFACQTLELTCKLYKDLLLHYSQIMGRAVLLPLISKKSKIRIAGLRTLTAIFWCGLYKYNAFIFENLIGFRDPNSVPIKDFYEPSHNVNYLATFITDSNSKVRIQFMKNLKIWICDLDDKYDHHGKLVPYLLSGLFDKDQTVQQISLQAIQEIGQQLQRQRQKDFRQSKQFAIDAKWTWEGKLTQLSVNLPLTKRPSLGSRFFIRGHVRKFWNALYREIKDINIQNRIRACNLAIYGAIYTENYLTQYLDDMIPHLLSSVIPHGKEEIECCLKIQKFFYYIGRFCEQSSYLHIMKSALQGKLVQNEQFIKASLKALTKIIEGSLQAIPKEEGLCHKKQEILQLLQMIKSSGMLEQIYHFNCKQAQNFVVELLKGLNTHATKQQIQQIFEQNLITLIKLWSVGYYEQSYFKIQKIEAYSKQNMYQTIEISSQQLLKSNSNPESQGRQSQQNAEKTNQRKDRLMEMMSRISGLSKQNFVDYLQQYLSQVYQNPPSLMDSDFKLTIVLNNYLIKSKDEDKSILFSLTQQIISESISYNRSVEILNFCFKYLCWLLDQKQEAILSASQQESDKKSYKQLSQILQRCLSNLNKFKPQRKIPTYDQAIIQQSKKQQTQQNKKQQDRDIMKINQDTYLILFKNASQAFRKFYFYKILLTNSTLGKILSKYVSLSHKIKRNQEGSKQSIKTLWTLFQRQSINEQFPKKIVYQNDKKQQQKCLPQVIDFVVQKIETLGQSNDKRISMLFSILNNWLKCFPIFANAAISLPLIYPSYNQLFQNIIKYAIDQKDIQLKQKFIEFLRKAAKKMKPWFQLELKMASQSQKFIKAQFLSHILNA